MKKPALVVLFAVALFAMPTFGERGDPPPKPAPKGPPTFVEEPIPAGKAVVYVYNTLGALAQADWGNVLVFDKDGLPTVLLTSTYCSFVTDPGAFQLVIVFGSGGQYGSGMLGRKLTIQTVAGQASFLGTVWGQGFKEIPAEKARKDDGILYCKKVE
jgi:hypothetical protein